MGQKLVAAVVGGILVGLLGVAAVGIRLTLALQHIAGLAIGFGLCATIGVVIALLAPTAGKAWRRVALVAALVALSVPLQFFRWTRAVTAGADPAVGDLGDGLTLMVSLIGFPLAIVFGLIAWLVGRSSGPGPKAHGRVSENHVVLRDLTDAEGSRLLTATLEPGGDLRIHGIDSGPGVERSFGMTEYEWIWTIKAAHIPRLLAALGTGPDVIEGLRRRFSGDAAAELGSFLEANEVPYEAWSRVGD